MEAGTDQARMLRAGRSWWHRYGCAPVLVVAATWATNALGEPVAGVSPLFFAAVALSAWYGGLGPGLLATGLAGLISAFLLFEPVYSLRMGWDDVLRIGVFCLVATLIGLLQAAMRRTHAQLADATEQALAANRAKDRFLAVLSHELRNPLNPILTVAGVLESDGRLPEDVREDMRMIRRNAELETRLVDDMLDLNRIVRGKLAMCFDVVDVRTLVEEVVGMCRSDAEAKGIQLGTVFAAERHDVLGDAGRLRQVLWNLMRNALKFTPAAGRVTVTTSAEADSSLRVDVADTGIGIEREALGRIFNAFEQADHNVSRQFGGLGLGLAISRSLVESHRGSLEASSPGSGLGATFTMRLPTVDKTAHPLPRRASPPEHMRRMRPESAGDGGPDALRILLVEGHADTARAACRVLRGRGHEVTVVTSVGDAVDAARHSSFDLLICDLSVSDGNAIDLVRRIAHPGLPAIALSGRGSSDEWRDCHDAGFQEYLSKPVTAESLEAAVRRLTHDRPRGRMLLIGRGV